MSSKFNNRTLLVVLILLGTLFVIARLTTVKKSSRTLRTELVSIDTARVSTILLYPKAEKGQSLLFERNGASWTVTREEVKAAANAGSLQQIIGELQDLKAEQLVARSPGQWEQFEVTDSLGTRVVVRDNGKTMLDLVVGRFQYQPAPGGNGMYGQNQGTARTYVRLKDEKEVYAVDGFLAIRLNQPFEQWRDRTVTRLDVSGLSRIIFDYPADSGFIAEKSEAGWMVAGMLADSTSMDRFLKQLARKSHAKFTAPVQSGTNPDFTVTFEGDNMKSQSIRVYQQPGEMVLNSSYNPDTWFSVTREGLFGEIFTGAGRLISGG
jgi:hypothetical protein